MHAPRKPNTLKLIQARRVRAKRMAAARWAAERERRAAAATMDPTRTGQEILRRIVVIDRETTARETVIYATDSARTARRKIRDILRAPL